MKTFKLLAPLALLAAITANPANAYDLSVGAATNGAMDGFTLQLGNDNLIGSFTYISTDTNFSGVSGTLDNTALTVGYKFQLVDRLEVFPLIGGGFYTYHDDSGVSDSETNLVYGGGVRYTVSKIVLGYNIQFDTYENTQAITIGYQF